MARAAIKEMHELPFAFYQLAGEDNCSDDHHSPSHTWEILIDAILKEPT